MIDIFKIIGALGLILIIVGVLIKPKNRKVRDIFYMLGGLCLAIYSIYIKDIIFVTLQIVFIIVAIYDYIQLQLKR